MPLKETILSTTSLTTERELQALYDPGSGLPNRALLIDRLEQALPDASRRADILAVLLLEIGPPQPAAGPDNTAEIAILKALAERLLACLKAGDTLAHPAGNQFAFLIKEIDQPSHLVDLCEEIYQAVSAAYSTLTPTASLTFHIGIALYPQDGGDAATLMASANAALQRAKSSGGNPYQFYDDMLNQCMIECQALETALRLALASDAMELHYQPQMALQSGKIVGVEAFLCCRHAETGVVSALQRHMITDESDIGATINGWILRQACQDMRCWVEAGVSIPRISINISEKQFSDPQLTLYAEQALTDMQTEVCKITLEITENALMQDTAAAEKTLGKLRLLGFNLALDDFGSEFSSLSYLKRFPLDYVKLGESINRDAVNGAGTASLSDALISMAHSLGIKVMAKEVETEAQCEYLRQHLCDEIQGQVFSAPVAAPEIARMWQENRRLPDHLLWLQQPARTLLLVDDESNILSALKRLLRRDGYHILTANSGQEGLDVLTQNKVDVIVSDQRMPGMMGVEFLRIAKSLYPETVRIVLSGYTELQSVTDAINEGAVYRFLTKPWEDQQLSGHIAEAFRHKEMADENQRLNLRVRSANQELADANRQLEQLVKQKQQQITRDEVCLNIVREVLQYLPLPMLGMDEDGMVAFINEAAEALLAQAGPLLGADASVVLPEIYAAACHTLENEECLTMINRQQYRITWRAMGQHSTSRGKLVSLSRGEGPHP